jgi:hypothetical protein
MTKRKTAEQAQDDSPENLSPATPTEERQPGDEPQRSWQERASVIVDEAGVRFHFDYKNHQAIITFDEKPSPELLERLRPVLNAGQFEWDKINKDGWKVKIRFPHREDDRREAKKTFYEVANVLREAKDLPTKSFGQDIPI